MKLLSIEFVYFVAVLNCSCLSVAPKEIGRSLVIDKVEGERSELQEDEKTSEIANYRSVYVESVATRHVSEPVDILVLSDGGERLVTVSGNRLTLWKIDEKQLELVQSIVTPDDGKCRIGEFQNTITSVDFSADGDALVFTYCDSRVVVLDGENLRELYKWESPNADIAKVFYLSDDRIGVASHNGRFDIWNRTLDTASRVNGFEYLGQSMSTKYARTMNYILSCGAKRLGQPDPEGFLELIDINKDVKLSYFQKGSHFEVADFNSNGSQIAVSDICNHKVIVLDMGNELKIQKTYDVEKEGSAKNASEDRNYCFTGDAYIEPYWLLDLKYVSNDALLISGPGKRLFLYSLYSNSVVKELRKNGRSITRVDVSKEKGIIASAYDSEIRIWKIQRTVK